MTRPTATLSFDETAPRDEEQEVLLWRVEQFQALGYATDVAWLLAQSSADLGQARAMAKAGCPPELGARILI
jgi:hypothetical protein